MSELIEKGENVSKLCSLIFACALYLCSSQFEINQVNLFIFNKPNMDTVKGHRLLKLEEMVFNDTYIS